MKKINIIILFILLFSLNKVYAFEFCDESNEHKEYMKLSEEEKKNYIEPIYCTNVTNEKNANNKLLAFGLNSYISASATDSSYNAASNNLVTNPKNQYSLGTCWSFSSISTVETNALKNNLSRYDFSESHMIYSVLAAGYSDENGKKGKYSVPNFNGGKITYAASYYFNNYGQLLENEMPYVDEEKKITSSQYKQGKKMITVGDFGLSNLTNFSACTSSEITSIKKKIINYGSIQASMYMDENLFYDSANDYYMATTSNSSLANHGITIVGWDDNISKSKFRNATRNGAWIVKNSWGSTWSNDGYFYISYDDHFVCKSSATFYNVSNTTYDYSYAASDMVGVPTFTLPTTFYVSSKFTKKSTFDEAIKRVSVAVGPNLNYKIYLSKSNNINSKSDWITLASKSSDEYGIKSVDVSNINVSDDFTVIVEYNSTSTSSIFTMCNNSDDTNSMSYSSNTNYFSTNGTSWSDFNSIKISGTTTSCEPNIYVYTNEFDEPSSYIKVSDVSVSKSTVTMNIVYKNINTSSVSYKITDLNNNNVTSKFTITPDYTNNKVIVKSDGYTSGKFYLVMSYNGTNTSKQFELIESITSKNSSIVKISSKNIIVMSLNNNSLTYENLMNYLNINNSTYKVYSSNNSLINSSSYNLTTNSKIQLTNSTYNIIILGDVNCDGKISALDYIDVRKHIMGTKIVDSGKLMASDMNSDSKITALDYIAIRKILMR